MWFQTLATVWYSLLACFINVLIWKSKFCFPSRWIPGSFVLLLISFHCYGFTIHLVSDYFDPWTSNYNNTKRWHGSKELGRFCKTNNLVTMLNDMKHFCYLDLKCSVMCCLTSNFYLICLNLYATLFMA